MLVGTDAAAISVGLVRLGIWQEWFLGGLFIAAAFVLLAAKQSGKVPGALLPRVE